jgi:CRP/FNR family cyclic AMP-dependent transcriptional regulator
MANFIWDNLFRNSTREKSIRHKIKANYLFQDLSLHELNVLERVIHVRSYRPGENIFRQGDVGVGMYIISTGIVNIYVEEIIPKTGEPKMALVTQLKESDFFGDLALVEENGRRSATAIANTDTTLIGFFKPDLLEITSRNPSAGVKILLRLGEILGQRLKETTSKISELRTAQQEEA